MDFFFGMLEETHWFLRVVGQLCFQVKLCFDNTQKHSKTKHFVWTDIPPAQNWFVFQNREVIANKNVGSGARALHCGQSGDNAGVRSPCGGRRGRGREPQIADSNPFEMTPMPFQSKTIHAFEMIVRHTTKTSMSSRTCIQATNRNRGKLFHSISD